MNAVTKKLDRVKQYPDAKIKTYTQDLWKKRREMIKDISEQTHQIIRKKIR